MSTDISIKKGLNIKLKGVAQNKVSPVTRSKIFAISPPHFHGITPKMALKAGDKVKVGDTIFYSKQQEAIKFTSPVSGEIKEIVRGPKRVILSINLVADKADVFIDFGIKSPDKLETPQIKEALLESGCWPFLKQRPYDVIADPSDSPKAIFISAVATAPLAASYDITLKGREKEFQTGIDALSKLTEGEVHLSVGKKDASFLENIKGVNLIKVSGKHPAGNVGVQISKIDPINSGDRIWVVQPQDVAIIGELFLTGNYNPTKIIALAGSQVNDPQYFKIRQGAQIGDIVKGNLKEGDSRIISGNPLSGTAVGLKDPIGFYDDLISVLPEGNHHRFLGWMPFIGNNIFSMSRTSLAWLSPNKEFKLDTNLNGEERAFVVTGEMEKVMPLDIYPMQLLKATLIEDIEKMENLGIYEVTPEDFGLVDFISSSKIEAQDIIRKGLDLMIKEVG